jgi:HK97 family phage major capsid protein
MTVATLTQEINDIKEKRANIGKEIHNLRKVTQGSEARALTGEEKTKVQKLQDDFDSYSAEVRLKEDELRSLEQYQRIEDELRGNTRGVETRETSGNGKNPVKLSVEEQVHAQRKLVRAYMQKDLTAVRKLLSTPEYRATTPMLAATTDAGGAVMLPMALYNGILEKERAETFFLRYGNVINMPKAKSLGVPTLAVDMDDAEWGKENVDVGTTRDEFTRGELSPKLLTKCIDISEVLLDPDMMEFDLEGFTMGRADYKFSITLEKAILTGTGVNQPLGLSNLPSARRVNQLTGTNDIYPYTDAVNAFTALRPPYRNKKSTIWVVGSFLYKGIMGCVDSNGRPLWVPSMIAGAPDTFLGRPINESEFLPTTDPGQDHPLGYFLDASYIWIPRVTNIGVKVLDQPLATKHLVRYRFSQWLDAQWMLDEACVSLWMND